MPRFEGIEDFEGPWFHSIGWDHSVDLDGTRFALVGAGASGFQIGPAIADRVEHLDVFEDGLDDHVGPGHAGAVEQHAECIGANIDDGQPLP